MSRKIAFIDRDGVINKKAPEHHYITSIDTFVFNKGIFGVLESLKKEGFEFIIITNQRGVARNLIKEETLHKIHDYMLSKFSEKNIDILDVLYCPHNNNECECRKPKPGLLEKACSKYKIDIAQSILISDSYDDVKMGNKFGLKKSYLVPVDKPEKTFDTTKSKIKIAFVKYGGLSAGGTEKMLQIIAANLPKEKFLVDYYYCDSSPYIGSTYQHIDTEKSRVKYMKDHNINLIKFTVAFKDITTPTHRWIETNFWDKFDETKYDIIQTGRAGHKEYPFTKIKKTPIVDILALSGSVDNQYNISRVMHICQWSADQWTNIGGDKNRVEIISLPVDMSGGTSNINLRNSLGLKDKFVYGMHQRPSNEIFSEIPLLAYKKIESEKTSFVMLGGGTNYRKQAEKLGIKNIHFLPASGNMEDVYAFLNTLDVYAHGRKDGEVNSQAMAEAMYYGLPIVSHRSEINNGHIECIAEAGLVVDSIQDYATEMQKLFDNENYYKMRSTNAKQRFIENYRIENVYMSVFNNPFPYPIKRLLTSLHWTQNIRILIKWLYLKTKFFLNGKI